MTFSPKWKLTLKFRSFWGRFFYHRGLKIKLLLFFDDLHLPFAGISIIRWNLTPKSFDQMKLAYSVSPSFLYCSLSPRLHVFRVPLLQPLPVGRSLSVEVGWGENYLFHLKFFIFFVSPFFPFSLLMLSHCFLWALALFLEGAVVSLYLCLSAFK